MNYPIYVAYEYLGNKEKEVEPFKGYIIFMAEDDRKTDLDRIENINVALKRKVYELTNLEKEDIKCGDFIILYMKELY